MSIFEDLSVRETEILRQCCRAITNKGCIYTTLAGYKYVEQTLLGIEDSPVIVDYLKSLGFKPKKMELYKFYNELDVLVDFGQWDNFEDAARYSACDEETAKFVWDSIKAGKPTMSEDEYINTNTYKQYLSWGKNPENILLSFIYFKPKKYISMSDSEFEDSIDPLSSMTFSGIAARKITGPMVDSLKARMREVRNLWRNTIVHDEAFKDTLISKYGLFEETLTEVV